MRPGLRQVLLRVAATLSEMEGPHGPRRYPDGTGSETSGRAAERLTERRTRHEQQRRLSWADLLLEAVALAAASPEDSAELEQKLLRVSALSTAWLEAIRARREARARADAPPVPGTVLHVRLPPRSLVYRAVVRRDGRIHIPALGRVLDPGEVQIQRREPDAPPPAPADDPLRPEIATQLAAIQRRSDAPGE